VISGADEYKQGIVLDRGGTGACDSHDAQSSASAVGDLLTTPPTPGHAMATNDPIRSFCAVIGKALRPFAEGQGVSPIWIL
jgi:hypothetical protein